MRYHNFNKQEYYKSLTTQAKVKKAILKIEFLK